MFVNAEVCDDKGKSVEDLGKETNSQQNNQQAEPPKVLTKIKVTTLAERTEKMVIQLQNPLVQEEN